MRRDSFFKESAEALTLADTDALKGCTTALVASNLYYFLRKHVGDKGARSYLEKVFNILDGADLYGKDVKMALGSDISDFEDALQVQGAMNSKVDVILTRNVDDFKNCGIPVLIPKELLALFAS